MELEKAKKELESLLKQRNEKQVKITTYDLFGAIETVLQALENSIPKEKVENKIEELKHKQLGASTGIYEAILDNPHIFTMKDI